MNSFYGIEDVTELLVQCVDESTLNNGEVTQWHVDNGVINFTLDNGMTGRIRVSLDN